ncbi:MAG TPA: AmmeMemoRadiSam system protein A [Anaerolineales bacterium]|nr:AmmeMemoRadiSam system protein A [Anaerolineales bacterium]
MKDKLTLEEQKTLLRMAREAIEHRVKGQKLPPVETTSLTQTIQEQGASFVTLTIGGQLRGCIGTLEAHQPLADDVREHAVAAAFEDPRFPPLREDELSRIQIEVSRLTRPVPLEYKDADDLISKLRPHIDGVILKDGLRRATFLPQVWEKLPNPSEFLDNLCYKMGMAHQHWRNKHLEVLTYQVEEFHDMTE